MIGTYVVVRSSPSGVWLGKLKEYDQATRHARLSDARRAWSWEGAATCSGLATRGPSGGKITESVSEVLVGDCCEILAATPQAIERWISVPSWVAK